MELCQNCLKITFFARKRWGGVCICPKGLISTKIFALALTVFEIFAKNHFQKIDVFRKLFIFFFLAYYWRFLKQFSSNFWTFSKFFQFFSLNFTQFFIFSVPIIEYFWKFLVQIFENFVTFSKNLQFFPEILWNFLFFRACNWRFEKILIQKIL